MDKLDSSAIDWIDFTQSKGKDYGVLSVHHRGKPWVYHYSRVPMQVYEAFKKAESAGQFFGIEIKGRYDFKKEDI